MLLKKKNEVTWNERITNPPQDVSGGFGISPKTHTTKDSIITQQT